MGRDRDALGRPFIIAAFQTGAGSIVDEPVDVLMGPEGQVHVVAKSEQADGVRARLEAGGAALLVSAGGAMSKSEATMTKAESLAPASWQGRPIADPDHAHELDREAAIHEFGSKLPRSRAEDRSYEHYKRGQHARAAAHHLLGMKAAQAVGDSKQAQKHGILYSQHLRSMGHEPVGAVPEEVQRHANNYSDERLYKFKPHRGDLFLFDGEHAGERVQKAEAAPAPIGASGPTGDVRQQPLHSTVEGFMGGLRAIPKGSPERGRFVTQHMNHGPFLAALKAHPQGAQVHSMLTQHLNGTANAGFKPGATVAVAKSERFRDVYRAAKFLTHLADLSKSSKD